MRRVSLLTPRPNKFRGAYCYSLASGTAITAAAIAYSPPPSGALITAFQSDIASYFGVVGAGQLAALAFVNTGNADQLVPIWGADYPLTGSFLGGRVTTVPSLFSLGAGQPWGPIEWEVFPPNVFVASAQLANLATVFGLKVREYLSAEELNTWGAASSREL